ncbi:MAG: polyketide cyclase [Rhodanobacteraceae bacterium]|nr:polyketide cyclase [Rhodanobacteraceae bacterium]
MTRILEFIVAAIMVFALAVIIGLALPSSGHIERSVEISHNTRHIADMLSNFRRFSDWGSVRMMDAKAQFTLEGPTYGPGAKVSWTSTKPNPGNGGYEITSKDGDTSVAWKVTGPWKGENKRFTITLEPQKNGRITKVTWAYDVDYGWDLIARYSGLYINGDPATLIQLNLASLSQQMAAIPNVDYSQTEVFVADVAAQPHLVVATTAPRSLDEVAAATDKAMAEIAAVMKKQNLTATGPRHITTVEWGDENYVFDVAVPVSSAALTIDGKSYTIGPATPPPVAEQTDDGAEPPAPVPGQLDRKGNLVVSGSVVARTGYTGKALVATWMGSPAGLPLTRLALKAYAMSLGYRFNENSNRYFDVMTTDPATVADDEQQFKVYLPITDNVPANEPVQPAAPPAVASGQR